jgi:diguanylate cyclase (GGDEF)-like protein
MVMEPDAFRQPQTLLALLRVAALFGLAICEPALAPTVLVPSVAYVLVACVLSLLHMKRPGPTRALLTAAASLDVIWFTVALLHVGPLNSLPVVLFVAVVAAVTASASAGAALVISLVAATVYYALSAVHYSPELGAAQRQLLPYQAAMIALAGTLSGYIAGQLSQLRRTRAMADRLERLNAATAEMTAASGDAELIRGALTHAADIIGADCLWVMLAGHDKRMLVLDGHIGASPSPATATAYPRHQGIAGRVVKTREPVVIEGSANQDPDLAPLEMEFVKQHLLAVPVADNGSVGGVLMVSRGRGPAFSDADLVLLTMLARFVGRALHAARLIRRLHRAASTDSLTGLYNHETFLKKLAEQISEAGRGHRPVSLIVLDMDDFKRVNDTAGHWAGDRVLKALAATLRRECRSVDIIGRYGGDEFAVVLPSTGPEEAAVIARRASQALRVVGDDLDLPVPVTASWGVASFPADGATDEQVFRRADARLYEAKDAGGDRVTFDSAVA